MGSNLLRVRPHSAEVSVPAPGDDLVPDATVIMDRAFDLRVPPAEVWPWIAQLGKDRAGWYFPRWVERVIPKKRRGLRQIADSLQNVGVGDTIPDWGGTFRIEIHDCPTVLVHSSTRGHLRMSWAILLHARSGGTRMHLRLRLAGVRHRRLAEVGGGLVDLLTVAGLAAGLRERVDPRIT
jgi:hypothetical protein